MTETHSAIDRFRAAAMADPAAQQHLAAFHDPVEFEAAAIAWAAAHGIALAPEDLGVARRADPIGMHMFGAAPQGGEAWPPLQWLPLRYAIEDHGVDWIHFAGQRLDAPFFADTVRRVRALPFNRLFRYRTPVAAFIDASRSEARAPDGLIFHMSRCGSTLAAQMLAAAPANIVVAEAEPLDTVVQLPLIDPSFPPDRHVDAIRAMVAALGRDRSGDARRYFVKLDSWHALALPLFRAAFPDTPWIFLYRDPVEVLVSQMRMRGQQTVPGVLPPQLFGLAPGDEQLPEVDYVARVLARTCEAAIEGLSLGGGMLVDYRELPDALFARILPHFGAEPDPAERALMRAAAERDAKAPDTRFIADSEEKRREAGAEVRAAAERHLAGIHARLQALRAV